MPYFLTGVGAGITGTLLFVQYNYACLAVPTFLKGLGFH